MLGIVVGIAAVIVMVAVGNGARKLIQDQIESLGTNLLLVTPGNSRSGGVNLGQGTAVTLNYADAKAIAQQSPAVLAVSPVVNARATASYLAKNTTTTVAGVVPAFLTVRNFAVDQGRFISQDEVDVAARVAVLGAGVERDLFKAPSGTLLGKSVKINQQNYAIIGILRSKGGSGLFNQDDQIFVPLTTAQRRLFPTEFNTVNQMVVQARSTDQMTEATVETAAILRQRHHLAATREDDFTIQSQNDVLKAATSLTTVMTAFLGAIASISLLVGGIGIMNIMLVSVTERTREIGIRRAVGARRTDVLGQFLVEAVLLCGLGGIGGVLIGMGVSKAAGNLSAGGLSLVPVVQLSSVVLALGISMLIGLFFGLYPAHRASRLTPIDALRYE